MHEVLADATENGLVQVSAAIGLASFGDDSGKTRALQAVQADEPWADLGINALEVLKATDVISTLESELANTPSESVCEMAPR